MTFSTNSWHASLHRLTWGKWTKLPPNLCPYFWKIVLALILFIPFTLLALPVLIYERFDKPAMHTHDGYLGGPIVIFGMMIELGITVAICMILVFFHKNSFTVTFGVMGYIVGTATLFVLWRVKVSERRLLEQKEKKPNLFVEFIKAKYNRYCPKIDWKNNLED